MSAESERHILVVDDDRLVLASLARGLRLAGYRVTEAASGEDAIEQARADLPALALLDVRMPGMDGIELGGLLRERYGIPFLYLSAYGQSDIVEQAAANGALGYLIKPLDITQILPAVETALSRAGEMRTLREREGQLSTALSGSRAISVAIGLLMERHHMGQGPAFEALRARARSERRPLVEVAEELVNSSEKLNSYNTLRPKLRGRKPASGA